MRLLLDTHVLLRWWADDPLLRPAHRDAIGDARNEVLVSSVSLAEIAVKASIGKLTVRGDFTTLLPGSGFTELPLTSRHVAELAELPLLHRDPFDRMLVAQARAESCTLLTVDERVRAYDVATG